MVVLRQQAAGSPGELMLSAAVFGSNCVLVFMGWVVGVKIRRCGFPCWRRSGCGSGSAGDKCCDKGLASTQSCGGCKRHRQVFCWQSGLFRCHSRPSQATPVSRAGV